MKLSDWSSIAEIASGLAVVVTLVLLLIGIRDNTEVTRASMYFALIDSINEADRAIWSDAELSRIFMASIRGQTDDLTELDVDRLRQILVTSLRNMEKGYFARDLIGEAEWERFRKSTCRAHDRGISIGLSAIELDVLTEEYRDFISQTCI